LAEKMRGNHNSFNPWQGNLRIGHFDHVLNGYAVQACRVNNFPISALAVTHLDGLLEMEHWTHCEAYDVYSNEAVTARRLMWADGDARTNMLRAAVPYIGRAKASEHDAIKQIEHYVGIPVVIKSTGPTAENKVSLL
jgi:adenylosuccinate synthase